MAGEGQVLPRQNGRGGAEKVLAMLKGGSQKVLILMQDLKVLVMLKGVGFA